MKKANLKPATNRGYLKKAIIEAMRGYSGQAPAIGENNCICEAVLVERIFELTGERLKNEFLCGLIKELRDLYEKKPQKINGRNCWAFNVETPEGNCFSFFCAANEYICGSNKGRYFAATVEELEKYQQQRKADYETQLKNSKTAAIACRHFSIDKSPKLF